MKFEKHHAPDSCWQPDTFWKKDQAHGHIPAVQMCEVLVVGAQAPGGGLAKGIEVELGVLIQRQKCLPHHFCRLVTVFFLPYDVRVKKLQLDPFNLEYKNLEQSPSSPRVWIPCFLIGKRFIVQVLLRELIN